MEIREMNLEQIEERRAALAEEIKTADMERLNAINAELDEIEKRKAEIKAQAEERAKVIEEVLQKPAEPTIITEERTPKKMTDREIRSTQEYIDAYVAYVKSGYDVKEFEKRMPDSGGGESIIYSANATSGGIAVPVYVEDRINANWENNEILSRVKRTFFRGNVQVGVEYSATGAVNHGEADGAIKAETLDIRFVDLIPQYIKKMIKVSHPALELSGTAFLDYLYDEIEAKIFDKLVDNIIAAITTDTDRLTATYHYTGDAPTTADIINAAGLLGPNARPVLLINRQAAAALKAAALTAQYGYDPFDGLEVIYANAADPIVADLSAIQVNFPDGDVPKFIFDEYTDAPANVVRIIGRLAAAVAVVAKGMIVKIEAH